MELQKTQEGSEALISMYIPWLVHLSQEQTFHSCCLWTMAEHVLLTGSIKSCCVIARVAYPGSQPGSSIRKYNAREGFFKSTLFRKQEHDGYILFIGSHNIKLRETTEVPRRITIAHTPLHNRNSFFEKFKRVDPRAPYVCSLLGQVEPRRHWEVIPEGSFWYR